MSVSPLLAVQDLTVSYPSSVGHIEIIKQLSFAIAQGEVVGLVGESGCGKSTLAKAVCHLASYQAGSIQWRGNDLAHLNPQQLQQYRQGLQLIFQSPQDALDPRMTIAQSIMEPLDYLTSLNLKEKQARLVAVLAEVGLEQAFAGRYPHELSGGQCQRVNIARALIVKPQLLVCDEAVSSLDVSMQSQIINLLRQLHYQHGMSLLYISHDINSVRYLCDRMMVMRNGQIVEDIATDRIEDTKHLYTRRLLSLSI